MGGDNKITLITRDGTSIAQGDKIVNHLYQMKMTIQNPPFVVENNTSDNQTFVGNNMPLSWETWHWNFGDVGYTGLQKLFNEKLVDGFNVDQQSPKPDCVTCTEVKQHIELFPKFSKRYTQPGELTRIDLWGKYVIKSINSNQYYLLFVDV